MHLKKLLQALSYRLLIVLMCGTLASTFVKFVFNADSVHNIECQFIKGEELKGLSKIEIELKNPAQEVMFEPKQLELEVVSKVPYPYRLVKLNSDTS